MGFTLLQGQQVTLSTTTTSTTIQTTQSLIVAQTRGTIMSMREIIGVIILEQMKTLMA